MQLQDLLKAIEIPDYNPLHTASCLPMRTGSDRDLDQEPILDQFSTSSPPNSRGFLPILVRECALSYLKTTTQLYHFELSKLSNMDLRLAALCKWLHMFIRSRWTCGGHQAVVHESKITAKPSEDDEPVSPFFTHMI